MRPARVRRILWVGQDEAKALWFRLFAASREQQVCTLRVPAPSLIWVHGQWSGDMMIDGVPRSGGAAAQSFEAVACPGHVAGALRERAAGISDTGRYAHHQPPHTEAKA